MRHEPSGFVKVLLWATLIPGLVGLALMVGLNVWLFAELIEAHGATSLILLAVVLMPLIPVVYFSVRLGRRLGKQHLREMERYRQRRDHKTDDPGI